MRLAFFYRDYLHGGAYPRDTRLLAEALAKRVDHVFVYCYTKNREEEGECTDGNVTTRIYFVPARYWSRNVVSVPAALRRRLAANEDAVDLVTLVCAFVPENYPIARLLRRSDVPYVVSPGEPLNAFALKGHGLRWMRKRLYVAFGERYIMANAAGVQVCSHAHLVHLHQLGLPVAPSVAFVGREAIDWERVHEEQGSAGPVSPPEATAEVRHNDAPTFGYLGRLRTFHKGLDVLIEAWSMYRILGGAGRLRLVGPGTERERKHLRRLCHRHGVPDVEILPPRFGREKFAYLESLSVLVHPSRHDGITRVIREGLASGCILMTTYNTHVYELLERHGAGYVVGLDPFELALSMLHFGTRTPEERAALRRGAAEVARELNWDAGAGQFLTGIERIVAPAGRLGAQAAS